MRIRFPFQYPALSRISRLFVVCLLFSMLLAEQRGGFLTRQRMGITEFFIFSLSKLLPPPMLVAHAQTAQRPNVVFILSDDHRHDALGIAGHPLLKTPNLDRIANEGIWLRQATVVTPLCAPSRAAFLSGLYGHTSGFRTNNGAVARKVPSQLPECRPGCRLPYCLHWQEACLQHR